VKPFIASNRKQAFLLPPSIDEWLDKDHLARFIADIIEQLDLSHIYKHYSGQGKDAYDPKVLLALLFYGYATGIFSSRKIERSTYDSVAFRFLSVNTHPDHDTIAHFRKRFLSELTDLFVQILGVAQEKYDSRLIVHQHVTQNTNDKQEIEVTMRWFTQHPELKPRSLLADTGYYSEANIDLCEHEEITSYISFGKEQHNQPLEERFKDADPLPEDPTPVEKMRHRLQTKEGKSIYAERKSTVEPVFGIIKHVMGFRQFMLRGFQKAQGEWNLICIAYNLKRLHTISGQ